MKKTLIVLLALAMVLSLLVAFPVAVSADEEETTTIKPWNGTANIQWYLDAIQYDPDTRVAKKPNATEFHLKTAEDLAGLSYLVNAVKEGRSGPTPYDGLWYDRDTGTVLGFQESGAEVLNRFDYEALGLDLPAAKEKVSNGGGYSPDYDDASEDLFATTDGSVYIAGDSFTAYEDEDGDVIKKHIYLDSDIILNECDAKTVAAWAASETRPAGVHVWMPIGGGRDAQTHEVPTDDGKTKQEGGDFAGFNGVFHGQCHTISGAYFDGGIVMRTSGTTEILATKAGLFGYDGSKTLASVAFYDLTIENCYFKARSQVAALIGRTHVQTNITNCHVKNCITRGNSDVGGLVGAVHGGSLLLDQCSVTDIDVEGTRAVGAFVSSVNYQNFFITNCFATGKIRSKTETTGEGESASTTGGWDVGIIVGRAGQSTITVQYVIANVKVIQEATDGNKAYSATCGAVYGGLGKDGGTGKEYPVTPSVDSYYYVRDFEARGQILPSKGESEILLNNLKGKNAARNLSSFDFEEIWETVDGDIPALRNVNTITKIDDAPVDPSGSGDDPSGESGTHVHSPGGMPHRKVEPGCETKGMEAYEECSGCQTAGYVNGELVTDLSTLEIPATGHEYGAWIEEVPATSKATGTKAHYHCDKCGKNFDIDHNEIDDLTIQKTGKSGGCGGVVIGVPFVGAVVLGAVLVLRKKENESK